MNKPNSVISITNSMTNNFQNRITELSDEVNLDKKGCVEVIASRKKILQSYLLQVKSVAFMYGGERLD
jgi:hypothetical protein